MIIYMIMITHESVLISILSQLWRGLNPLFSSNHYKELHDKIHLMLSPVHVVCMSLVIVCVCVCVCVSVCFRELVKLFCTESIQGKELFLRTFLHGLITSLDVSYKWSLQTLITNPGKRAFARSQSPCRSLSFLSHFHTGTPPVQSWLQLELID